MKHSSKDNQLLFEVDPRQRMPAQKDRDTNDYVFDITDALSSPILTFSQSWASCIPERILKQVGLARMIALKKEETLATYVECLIYIYTRTLEAPMDSDWTNIYMHVSCSVLEEWFGEDHWDDMQAPRSLNNWLESKLKHLRQHIYKKRREILKTRFKAIKADEKQVEESLKKSKPAIVQAALFNF